MVRGNWQQRAEQAEADRTKLLDALKESLLYDEHQEPCRAYIGDEPCICGYQAWWEKANAAIKGVDNGPQ